MSFRPTKTRWNHIIKNVAHKYAKDNIHKPGDVWQTQKGNWRALDPKGDNPKTFNDKEEADQYAKGNWRREVRDKDMEEFFQSNVKEVFSQIDKRQEKDQERKDFFTVPRGIKRLWKETKDDFLESLTEGKYRRAILEGAGDVLKASLKTISRTSGIKEFTRATDAITSKALKGVVVFGENVDLVKDEFKDRVEDLKNDYDFEKEKLGKGKDTKELDQKYQDEYEKEKELYEKRMNSAVSYSELKNYRMMGKVVGNALMGSPDEFDLSEEEKKTGWMYLGYLVSGTVMGGSAAVATGLSKGLKGALIPLLGSTIGSAMTGKIGALAIGSLAYKAVHVGIRSLQNKMNKDKEINSYLDDYIAGFKSMDGLEQDLLDLKKEAQAQISKIEDQKLPRSEERDKIQEVYDHMEEEEVKIHEAMSKGEKALAKYAHLRVAHRYLYGSGDPKEAYQKILQQVIELGLEESLEEIKKDPKVFLEDLADGVSQYLENANEEGNPGKREKEGSVDQQKAKQALNRINKILWEWHQIIMVDEDYPALEKFAKKVHNTIKKDVATIDLYLTGKERQGHYDDRYIKDMLLGGDSFEVYLSDGGYSRIVFHPPVNLGDTTVNIERSLSFPKVNERWNLIT